MERSEQTSAKSFHVTEKRALEIPVNHPTCGRGAATVLNFTGALLVEYIYLLPKKCNSNVVRCDNIARHRVFDCVLGLLLTQISRTMLH